MNLKPLIEELIEELDTRKKELTLLEKAIANLQELCKHEWVNDGNCSHYDYQICTKCFTRRKA